MIPGSSLTCSTTNPKSGYLLLELCMALTLGALLATLFASRLQLLCHGYTSLLAHLKLNQAQRYMFNMLEYELTQNAAKITIRQEGEQLLVQSLSAQRQLTYNREYVNHHYGLYLTTINAKGTSKNPLFIPECELLSWKAQALGDNRLSLELSLSCQNRQATYKRAFILLNGRVENE